MIEKISLEWPMNWCLPQNSLHFKAILDYWSSIVRYLDHENACALIPKLYGIPNNYCAKKLNIPSIGKTQFFLLYLRQNRHLPGLQDLIKKLGFLE